jgi:hypothetical protein
MQFCHNIIIIKKNKIGGNGVECKF